MAKAKIDYNKMQAMQQAGYSQQQIGCVFNVTQGSVSMALKKLKKTRRDPLVKKICALAKKTLTVEQIFELIDLYYDVNNFYKNGNKTERMP